MLSGVQAQTLWLWAPGESATLFLLPPGPAVSLGQKTLCRTVLTTLLTIALALLVDAATVASPVGASCCANMGKNGPAQIRYLFRYAYMTK